MERQAIVRTNDRLLVSRLKKTMHETDETKSQKLLWNEFSMQAKCLPTTTTILYSICTRARTKYNGRSVVGVNIWNSNWEQENSIRWMDFVNFASSRILQMLHNLNAQWKWFCLAHRHTCTGMDPTDCHVIVRLSPSSSSIPCLLIDMIILSRAYFAVHRVLNWTPQKTCPWNGSHRKKINTVPRLARCRKLCHQLNSISMQRNIYR